MSSTPPKSNDADSSASRATLRVKAPAAAPSAAPAARKPGPRAGGYDSGAPRGAGRRDDRPCRDDARGDRDSYAPRGERSDRFERNDRPSRPYAPRDGQAGGGRDGGQGDRGGFGRPDRPYQPRDDRGAAPRGDREGFAPRADRGDRGGDRFERNDRPSRPYAPRDGQGGGQGYGRDGGQGDRGGFGRPDRPYQPRDDRAAGPRGDREGFAPRADRGDRGGDRFERNDRPSRPYAPRDGQGDRGGFGRPDRPYQPRDDRGAAPRGDREGFAPRADRGDRGGDRFERNDHPSRPYAPRDGQGGGQGYGRDGGQGDRGGFGRPDRPYQPRDDRAAGPRGDREGFAPRADRGDRGGDRFERNDRPSRPYAARDGQAGGGQGDRGSFGRPERPFQPRDDRGAAPRGDREGFAPRADRGDRGGDRFERSDRPSRPYAARDGQGGGRDGGQGAERARRPYGDDRAPRPADGRSRDDFRAERRAGPKPGEERTYGSIRTYRAPEGLAGKAAPIKITRPDPVEPREDARPGDSRINKRMAELGMCSRREADEWVENGWVKVNGEVAVMGQLVIPSDRIEIDRAAQDRQEQQVTILMHKPMGYVSGQAEDGHEPAIALINPMSRWNLDTNKTHFNFTQLKGLAPCGRLDIDSVGLLVLTQDGRVARQIIGEDSVMDKEYLVRVTYEGREVDIQSVFPADQLERLRHGLELDGEPLQPAEVTWQNPEQLRFVLTEGKKRQIRRMCEQVGLHVVGLKRIRIGKIVLGNLPVGQWRYLGADEQF